MYGTNRTKLSFDYGNERASSERTGGSADLNEKYFNAPDCSVAVRPRARRICLEGLNVQSGDVVWDVGAGTGSVSLVSALNHPDARYYALEQSHRHFGTLLKNVRKLGTSNVVACHGRAPEDLRKLPSPDGIYLGGTGGCVRGITRALLPVLGSSDRLVASFILARNYAHCRNLLHDRGFRVMSRTVTFGAPVLNTVYFLIGRRPEGQRF